MNSYWEYELLTNTYLQERLAQARARPPWPQFAGDWRWLAWQSRGRPWFDRLAAWRNRWAGSARLARGRSVSMVAHDQA